jgi:hypothetical protein
MSDELNDELRRWMIKASDRHTWALGVIRVHVDYHPDEVVRKVCNEWPGEDRRRQFEALTAGLSAWIPQQYPAHVATARAMVEFAEQLNDEYEGLLQRPNAAAVQAMDNAKKNLVRALVMLGVASARFGWNLNGPGSMPNDPAAVAEDRRLGASAGTEGLGATGQRLPLGHCTPGSIP